NGSTGRLFPSIRSIARKVGCSRRWAQRAMHQLIHLGVVRVVGNETGGKPGDSRQYELDLEGLESGAYTKRVRVAHRPPVKRVRRGGLQTTSTGGAQTTGGVQVAEGRRTDHPNWNEQLQPIRVVGRGCCGEGARKDDGNDTTKANRWARR